ncbi:hypothetical protein [Saccharomonospora sp. CUA-673]|uniref:hypothetical protein n=1 Tax=Saccharomonospora sp. CUA-673 TaxID=1904969 RepID=UPI000A961CB1|nr:hypothetical protein [Saccharomonospora sp. CUA-673]
MTSTTTASGLRIGYSFWGFLGSGVTDTPDGGRSHRRTLMDGLIAAGHQVVFLQANRDLTEAGTDLRETYTWADGLPDIDVLVLEWRWPIPGRNTTPCGQPGHTCDLHRQRELLDHYAEQGLPTILWDKDQRLPADDHLRRHPSITVAEPALHPSPGAHSLLFPIADEVLDSFDPRAVTAAPGSGRWCTSATNTIATPRSTPISPRPPRGMPTASPGSGPIPTGGRTCGSPAEFRSALSRTFTVTRSRPCCCPNGMRVAGI